jgi:hypothetical protein
MDPLVTGGVDAMGPGGAETATEAPPPEPPREPGTGAGQLNVALTTTEPVPPSSAGILTLL